LTFIRYNFTQTKKGKTLKVLKKIILIILILNSLAFAKRFYYIKLGSFRYWSVLEKSINRLPISMRSHIVVVESNGWLIPYAYYTSKLHALKRKIYGYRRYFPDATITSSPQILNKRVFRDYRRAITRYRARATPTPIYYTQPSMAKTVPQPRPEVPLKVNRDIDYERSESVLSKVRTIHKKRTNFEVNRFNKKMLSGHNFYLAYKSPDGKSDLLIKLSFGTFKVTYQPIIGTMDMKEAKYLVEDNRLYMFADTFSENGAYSLIERVTKEYIVVSSWFGGKKINTLRYYYSLDKAKRYLGRENSSKLATALEDRSFDRVEQAFIGVDGVYIKRDEDEDW